MVGREELRSVEIQKQFSYRLDFNQSIIDQQNELKKQIFFYILRNYVGLQFRRGIW